MGEETEHGTHYTFNRTNPVRDSLIKPHLHYCSDRPSERSIWIGYLLHRNNQTHPSQLQMFLKLTKPVSRVRDEAERLFDSDRTWNRADPSLDRRVSACSPSPITTTP